MSYPITNSWGGDPTQEPELKERYDFFDIPVGEDRSKGEIKKVFVVYWESKNHIACKLDNGFNDFNLEEIEEDIKAHLESKEEFNKPIVLI